MGLLDYYYYYIWPMSKRNGNELISTKARQIFIIAIQGGHGAISAMKKSTSFCQKTELRMLCVITFKAKNYKNNNLKSNKAPKFINIDLRFYNIKSQ